MATLDVLVGRQPIFARDLTVMGYELLFRPLNGNGTAGHQLDGDLVTSTVLFSSASIGIERLVGDKLVFCNADYGLLTGAVPVLLPPERTVLEVLETVEPDDHVVAGCLRLSNLGYRLALDDFTWFDGAERLLDLASIVKIDIRIVGLADLPGLVARCREFEVTLLAEKVETTDELAYCRDLGFDLFQGYVLSRPQIVPGRMLDSANLTRIRLAASLVDDEFDVDDLEDIVRTDPSMGFQLLQLAGVGARHGMRRTVRTLHEALVLVGWRQLQNWIAFLLLTQRGQSSEEQVVIALTRARMSELIAHAVDARTASMAFTAGMLSALDLLFAAPIAEILSVLPLEDQLRDAALGEGDGVGRIVRTIIDYQAGSFQATQLPEVPDHDLHLASVSALTWAVQATRGITPHRSGSR